VTPSVTAPGDTNLSDATVAIVNCTMALIGPKCLRHLVLFDVI